PGVFIAYGPHITPPRGTHSISVFDIAPTVLTLLGLPQAIEMPGRPATWALKDLSPINSVRVVSYAEFLDIRPLGTPAHADPERYRSDLQAIGHLNDPARNQAPQLDEPARAPNPISTEKYGLYAYYNNLGVEQRGQGRLKDATETFQKAIELN